MTIPKCSTRCLNNGMEEKRLRLRDWLEMRIDDPKYPGLEWVNKDEKIFRIPWKHGARHGWKEKEDARLFMEWSEHTGASPRDVKQHKANFRCALNSLRDIRRVPDLNKQKGDDAYRVFRMLPRRNPRRKKMWIQKRKGYLKSDLLCKDFSTSPTTSQLPSCLLPSWSPNGYDITEKTSMMTKTVDHGISTSSEVLGIQKITKDKCALVENKQSTQDDISPNSHFSFEGGAAPLHPFSEWKLSAQSGYNNEDATVADVIKNASSVFYPEEESHLPTETSLYAPFQESTERSPYVDGFFASACNRTSQCVSPQTYSGAWPREWQVESQQDIRLRHSLNLHKRANAISTDHVSDRLPLPYLATDMKTFEVKCQQDASNMSKYRNLFHGQQQEKNELSLHNLDCSKQYSYLSTAADHPLGDNLHSSSACLRSKVEMLYSTCSLNPKTLTEGIDSRSERQDALPAKIPGPLPFSDFSKYTAEFMGGPHNVTGKSPCCSLESSPGRLPSASTLLTPWTTDACNKGINKYLPILPLC